MKPLFGVCNNQPHGSVAPDKRHCRQWTSSLFQPFCGFLHNPFIHDLFLWRTSQEFVKTDLYPLSLMCLRYAVCSTRRWSIIGRNKKNKPFNSRNVNEWGIYLFVRTSFHWQTKLLMARNFFRIFTENKPVRGLRKKYNIPDVNWLIIKYRPLIILLTVVALYPYSAQNNNFRNLLYVRYMTKINILCMSKNLTWVTSIFLSYSVYITILKLFVSAE